MKLNCTTFADVRYEGTKYYQRQYFGRDAKTRCLVSKFAHAEGLSPEEWDDLFRCIVRNYSDLWDVVSVFDTRIVNGRIKAHERLVKLLKGLSSNVSPVRQLIPNQCQELIQRLTVNVSMQDLAELHNQCPAVLDTYLGVLELGGSPSVRFARFFEKSIVC